MTEIIGALTPGPSIFNVLRHSMISTKNGLATACGQISASSIYAIMIVFGAGVIFQQYPLLLTLIQIAGAGYLAYLGFIILKYTYQHPESGSFANIGAQNKVSLKKSFILGFFVSFSNPKIIIYFLAVIPQFVKPDAGAFWFQLLILSAIALGVGLALYVILAYVIGKGSAKLSAIPVQYINALNYAFGALFFFFAIRLFFMDLQF